MDRPAQQRHRRHRLAHTVIVGLLLRRFVFDRGTATPFVIVATATLCAFIMGWRGATRWYQSRVRSEDGRDMPASE